ncbi:hypothetical protein TRVA0_001S00562 [Trichomonascus vanleenenianus]|uniref:uncharacterized protein n=1 Tax=Trichomonascus vanleenenianus TaxID=2268995 RepID=UPI003EC985F9
MSSSGNVDGIVDWVRKLAGVHGQTSRKTVQAVLIDEVRASSVEAQVLEEALPILTSHIVQLEEIETSVRARLADLLQEDEEYQRAAQVLQDGLGQDRRLMTNEKRFETLVRIVRLYLETGQVERAEPALSRAQHVRPHAKDISPETDVAFKLCQARIYDANRRFLDASNKYHMISKEPAVDEEDRMICLSQAIVCAVLSPAGPLRGHALRRLYTDERSKQTANYGILEKVFLNQLLLPADTEEFGAQLAPHQRAITADGTTVLEKAVIEHNLTAVASVYNNIGIAELGRFLGLDKAKAESYAAKMITQNRLQGKIDQVDGLIYFQSHLDSAPSQVNDFDYASGDMDGNGIVLLRELDRDIEDSCNTVESIVTALHDIHPEFVNSIIA